MRKLTAIILLLVFFTSQYEKQLSYTNCRIANYFKADGNKCECEKIVEENSNPLADNTIPPVHMHHHPDESYFAPLNNKEFYFSYLVTSFSSLYILRFPDGNLSSIEHPPQVG